MTFEELYAKLIDNGLFTEEELRLVTNINGDTIQTLDDCAYARYAIRSAEDLISDNSHF